MSKAKKKAAKKKAAKPGKVRMYLVLRDAFDANPYSGVHFYRPTNEDGDRDNRVPVRAFATRKAAQEHARQLDAELRATFPPPLFAEDDEPDDDDTRPSLPNLLTTKLKELSLPEIKFAKEEYKHGEQFREWWTEHASDMSAEQRAALWEPFADRTFHSVKKIEVEG